MHPLTAHNGLSFHVSFDFTIHMTSNQFKIFQLYFGNMVNYLNKINDDGINLQFSLNLNEEVGKFGRFKDVPTKAEITKFLPILLESDTYRHSDVVFLVKLINAYLEKERFFGRKVPLEITMIKKKLDKAVETPQIVVKNLVLNSPGY